MARTTRLIIVCVAACSLFAASGVWWFLRDDAPEQVDLDNAATQVTDDTSGSEASAEGVDGTWVVDTDSGEFDYESATGSFAGFRIEEELSGVGATTAVGRTGDVTGSILIEDSIVTSADFEVDITSITTDDSRRDSKVQDAMDTANFPSANFTLSEPIELGDESEVSVDATGELTIHGVTQTVTIPLETTVSGDTLVVVGSTEIAFSDYDVAVPEAPIIVSVDDFGVVEFQLLLTR